MNVQGFIKSIGTPREWDSRDGKRMYSYPVEIRIPFIGKDGTERADEIVADLNAANPDYVQKLEEARQMGTRLEFQLGFSTHEYKGRLLQNVKLWNLQILL